MESGSILITALWIAFKILSLRMIRNANFGMIEHRKVVNSFQNFIFKDDSQQKWETFNTDAVVNSFQNFIFKDDSQLMKPNGAAPPCCE